MACWLTWLLPARCTGATPWQRCSGPITISPAPALPCGARFRVKQGSGRRCPGYPPETLGFTSPARLWVDVTSFHHLLEENKRHVHASVETCPGCLRRLEQAAALYRGDFLAGFTLRDSPQFDDWQFFQSESLRRDLAGALEQLSHSLAAQGRYDDAILHARRRPGARLAARAGAPAIDVAVRLGGAGRLCPAPVPGMRAHPEAELGVEPMEETTRFTRRMKDHRLPPAPSQEGASMSAPALTSLPVFEASLPGIAAGGALEELSALESVIPACRRAAI